MRRAIHSTIRDYTTKGYASPANSSQIKQGCRWIIPHHRVVIPKDRYGVRSFWRCCTLVVSLNYGFVQAPIIVNSCRCLYSDSAAPSRLQSSAILKPCFTMFSSKKPISAPCGFAMATLIKELNCIRWILIVWANSSPYAAALRAFHMTSTRNFHLKQLKLY